MINSSWQKLWFTLAKRVACRKTRAASKVLRTGTDVSPSKKRSLVHGSRKNWETIKPIYRHVYFPNHSRHSRHSHSPLNTSMSCPKTCSNSVVKNVVFTMRTGIPCNISGHSQCLLEAWECLPHFGSLDPYHIVCHVQYLIISPIQLLSWEITIAQFLCVKSVHFSLIVALITHSFCWF